MLERKKYLAQFWGGFVIGKAKFPPE